MSAETPAPTEPQTPADPPKPSDPPVDPPKPVVETKPVADKDEAADDSAKEAPSTVEATVDPDASETKLFEQKAILYRFDKEAKDWKERGVGFMKILKNPENGRCRVLMRRAQTFRVCANHFILPGTTLKANGDKAVLWHATDFADGKESNEILSVKFKSPEIVQEFKTAFDSARAQNQALGATGGESAE
jgi:Ran-binding protein 1